MDGVGRSRVLAVVAPDPVMSVIAPVGLAVAAGTALVIDRVGRRGIASRTLADLIADGPRLDEVSPGRSGVAVLESGPVALAEAAVAVEELASRWPAVVVSSPDDDWPGPKVPVHVLYGSGLSTWDQGAAVWQSLGNGERPPGPGPVLPALGRRSVRQMLHGWLPRPGRWVRAWRPVWEMPWA